MTLEKSMEFKMKNKMKISIDCITMLAPYLWDDIKAMHKVHCVGDYYESSICDGDETVYTDGKPYCIVNGVIGYMDGDWKFQPKAPKIGDYVFVTDKGFQYVTIIK
jgi:hypothetical protein